VTRVFFCNLHLAFCSDLLSTGLRARRCCRVSYNISRGAELILKYAVHPSSFYVKSQAWFRMDRLAGRFLPVFYLFLSMIIKSVPAGGFSVSLIVCENFTCWDRNRFSQMPQDRFSRCSPYPDIPLEELLSGIGSLNGQIFKTNLLSADMPTA
jgi:hypothetical protein